MTRCVEGACHQSFSPFLSWGKTCLGKSCDSDSATGLTAAFSHVFYLPFNDRFGGVLDQLRPAALDVLIRKGTNSRPFLRPHSVRRHSEKVNSPKIARVYLSCERSVVPLDRGA